MTVIGINDSMWYESAHAAAKLSCTPYHPSAVTDANSNGPKKPGVDGTATQSTMSPCTNSAAEKGAVMPIARNMIQKAKAWASQRSSAQKNTTANLLG